MQIAVVLTLLFLAVVLFAMEKLSVDIITMMLLIVLIMAGILTANEAFAGFSQDIIIILGSIFVISGALQRTGVLDAMGAPLQKIASQSHRLMLFAVMCVVGSVSAFMNNTTVTAIFVPPVIGVARKLRISPSKLLMPVAFASILGGTCTLIGTSTNVAVSGYIQNAGMQPVSLFEITPLGIVILVIGIAYMMLIGQRFLPDHVDESLTEEYEIREYLTEILVVPGSHMIGQKIFASDLSRMEFRILEVIRGEEKFLPDARTVIEPSDVLLVEGKVADLIRVKEAAGIEIRAEVKLGDKDLQSDQFRIIEVLVTPQSSLRGQTLKEANFRARFGMTALAIYRHGQSLRDKIGRIRLRLGDMLLVQGPSDRLEELRRQPDLWVLGEYTPPAYSKTKGFYTIAFFIGAIIIGSTGLMPLSVAFLSAAVMTLLTRCITVEEAYEFIDWRLLILIGGMTAFGTAMDDKHTGAAGFLATGIVKTLNPVVSGLPGYYGILVILAGFFLLTVILTQPMSNAAAALVVLPVAIETAQQLGVNERTFAIAIMMAASVSFITPFEPSCILVYGPGKYRFRDFLKVGLFLTIILIVVVLFLLPMIWPFDPMPGHGTS
jgi:di/tricarboxylate transporter